MQLMYGKVAQIRYCDVGIKSMLMIDDTRSQKQTDTAAGEIGKPTLMCLVWNC